MTVGTKVKQALSNLKSAQADFEEFALETREQAAKQIWSSAAQQCRDVAERVSSRMADLEKQEPEYKGY